MRALTLWCATVTAIGGAYAMATLIALARLPCDFSLDPGRFCAWWEDSGRAPAFVGVPAVLALGWYASLERDSPRPVLVAAVLVVLSCSGLRAAAGPFYFT
jgi:hypothetical protein